MVIGMLRLRVDDRFTIIHATLSMTLGPAPTPADDSPAEPAAIAQLGA